jgi:hypothetical protein
MVFELSHDLLLWMGSVVPKLCACMHVASKCHVCLVWSIAGSCTLSVSVNFALLKFWLTHSWVFSCSMPHEYYPRCEHDCCPVLFASAVSKHTKALRQVVWGRLFGVSYKQHRLLLV